MNEQWKDVGIIDCVDYTGLYQVSNYGLVKSLNYGRTGREEILTPGMTTDGYLHVCLSKDRKKKWPRINRLVAIEFNLPIPEELKHLPLEKLQVNHKDEDKTNNCVWNLEWCDANYNDNYGTRNKRIADANSKKVLQLDKDTLEVIREWPSLAEVYKQLGYAQQNISACCLGKLKSAYGFKWKYA